MKTKIETITPDSALQVLENHNPRNRHISEATVQSYATDMKNGRWLVTHQGIAFDEKGDLIDGQHRLWAVIFCGKPVDMNVTREIPLSALKNGIELYTMDTIDRGRLRSVGQQLALCHGIANSNQVTAACRAIACAIYTNRTLQKLSTANVLIIMESYYHDIERVLAALENRKRLGFIVGTLAMYHHGEPQKAELFCHQISTLEELSPAARAFVKFLDRPQVGRQNYEQNIRTSAQSIWNFHKGNDVKVAFDANNGRDFLCSMFPSISKKIREALRPCEVKGFKEFKNKN